MRYKVRCHVCHAEFDREAEFISCAQWPDGRLMMQCGKHKGPEVRAAWEAQGRPIAPTGVTIG